MKITTTLFLFFILMTLTLSVKATSVCMEGYDNGTDCTLFDYTHLPWVSITDGRFGRQSTITEYGFDPEIGGVYFFPWKMPPFYLYQNTGHFPFEKGTAIGTSQDDPHGFWCNNTNAPKTVINQDWAYSNTGNNNCTVLTILRNSKDPLSAEKFPSIDYKNNTSGFLTTKKNSPSKRVELGIAQSIIYKHDYMSNQIMSEMLSGISTSGINTIRIPVNRTPLTLGDVSEPYFENLIDVIRQAKEKQIDVVVQINIFDNIKLPRYYSYTENPNDITKKFKDLCWDGGAMRITEFNKSDYQQYLTYMLSRFVSEKLTNIIGIELGNELDTVCYNADVPFDGMNEPSMTGRDFSDSANAYAELLIKTSNALDEVYSQNLDKYRPKLVTYGMTFSYRSWHVMCDDHRPYSVKSIPSTCPNHDKSRAPVQLLGWDGINYLAQVFISKKYTSDVVDVIGYHFYVRHDVVSDLKNIYYPAINPDDYPNMPKKAVNFFKKDAWVTEWGIKAEGPWPSPIQYYDKYSRYRAMVEVMEHLNIDPEASKVKKAFLYSFYSPDGYSIGDLANDQFKFRMPESRIIKLYANDLTDSCGTGGWNDPCDSDSDGVIDAVDAFPLSASALVDTDSDGMPDSCMAACSIPLIEDTDDDNDGIDDANDKFPTHAITGFQDSDKDGAPDVCPCGSMTKDNDFLSGSSVADIFKFNALSELGETIDTVVTINDFNCTEKDKIDFSGIQDVNTVKAGKQPQFKFIGAKPFSQKGGEIRFDPSTNMLQLNTDVDLDADYYIKLTGITAIYSKCLILNKAVKK